MVGVGEGGGRYDTTHSRTKSEIGRVTSRFENVHGQPHRPPHPRHNNGPIRSKIPLSPANDAVPHPEASSSPHLRGRLFPLCLRLNGRPHVSCDPVRVDFGAAQCHLERVEGGDYYLGGGG